MILKRKTRYIMVRSSHPADLSDKTAWQQLRIELSKFLGEKEYLNANPFFAEQIGDSTFIIRVMRGSDRAVILALSFTKLQSEGKEVGFYTLKTSGTIRALKSKTIRARRGQA